MTRLTLLAGAAALAALIASPASAQQSGGYRNNCDLSASAVCPSSSQRGRAYRERDAYRDRDYDDSNAFWPGEVAADVVGGAVGTAAAIATAPFADDGDNRGWDRSYAQRNGFVCQPGTWFRGEDGRPHPCQ